MTGQVRWWIVSALVHGLLAGGGLFFSGVLKKDTPIVIDFSIENSPQSSPQPFSPTPPSHQTAPKIPHPSQSILPHALAQDVFPDTTDKIDTTDTFDKTITADTTQALAVQVVAHVNTDSLASLKAAYISANYGVIRDSIYHRLKYPEEAIENNWEGEVLVSFWVHCNGLVDNIKIVKSSGYDVLDMNAIAAVQNGGPYPKSPRKVEVQLPMKFHLE